MTPADYAAVLVLVWLLGVLWSWESARLDGWRGVLVALLWPLVLADVAWRRVRG